MTNVCELRKLTGGRYLVVLEDDSCFPLYRKELDELGICEGQSLLEEAREKIWQEILPKRAKLCALHFLQSSDRTEQQLCKKLSSLYYPEDVINEAVAYVKSYHYIDDVRYAVNYMEYHREGKSMRRMERELYQKGISKAVFYEAVQQIEEPDEAAQIRQWLIKKRYSPDSADQKETERLYRFLVRKGYSRTQVHKALRMWDS